MVRVAALAFLFCAASGLAQTDAKALLEQGSALVHSKPAEAIKVLKEALRIDPELPGIHYQLGTSFYGIGDFADAEAELREAVTRDPDSAPAHKLLGLTLMKLGISGEGQRELRTAAGLAPEQKTADAATGPTIKVDVRQVLVPVVVTDKQGHHVSGLTEKDFRILEDGVEQKITSFALEQSGSPQAALSSPEPPSPGAPPKPAPAIVATHPAPRRTYLICIDTLHSSFNNFVAAREALKKLFAREHSEDSQYVVIALGYSAQVVLNTTSDPAAVLAALGNKRMQTLFLSGQTGGLKPELERYRRDLNHTREICDLYTKTHEMILQIDCQTGMERAPREAQSISELDRTLIVGFLRQFRFLVAQLAQARDRRTIVFLSDGFQIVPGREAYDLLNAYFPDLRGYSLPSGERLQSEFEPILKAAAASNITIDTIDSRGLYGLGAFDASNPGAALTVAANVDRVDRNIASADGNTLAEIAEATGGTAFHDRNDLLTGLERAFADGRDYYTLGYTSTNESHDGKFRAIAVQVQARDVTVNAKKGYWAEVPAQ